MKDSRQCLIIALLLLLLADNNTGPCKWGFLIGFVIWIVSAVAYFFKEA